MAKENRRIHVRASMPLTVVFEANSGRREARTGDVSLGGCFVDAIHEVANGEAINLKINLPTGDWISVDGIVVYAQWPTGFGVRFTDISDDARQRLEDAIAAYIVEETSK